jgi:hypothetical protein
MDNDEIRKWAAEWVGWKILRHTAYQYPSATPVESYVLGGRKTDADLAEAVRVKFILAEHSSVENRVLDRLMLEWLKGGPLAFIAAVREIVS